MEQHEFNSALLRFIDQSPTPFHAVSTMATALIAAGYEKLDEGESWQLVKGGKYYVTRNDSSIIAFIMGHNDAQEHGVRMVGAHTDSPCLRVKPNPEIHCQGYFQLGVEIYGGVLLNPWFDRDLSLAGRVSLTDHQGRLVSVMIDFKRPIAVIPNLAIHLDRTANDNRSVKSKLICHRC